MPAVRNAAGPISVPACEAPISMGTPSSEMSAVFAELDIGRYLKRDRRVRKARRAYHQR